MDSERFIGAAALHHPLDRVDRHDVGAFLVLNKQAIACGLNVNDSRLEPPSFSILMSVVPKRIAKFVAIETLSFSIRESSVLSAAK